MKHIYFTVGCTLGGLILATLIYVPLVMAEIFPVKMAISSIIGTTIGCVFIYPITRLLDRIFRI